MEINKLVFGGLAVGCMAAAAGGGYLAARPEAPASVAAEAASAAPGLRDAPVTESEGIIVPASVPEAVPPDAVAPAPVRRSPAAPARAAAPAARLAPAAARRAAVPPPPRRAPEPVAPAPAPAPAREPAAVGGMWEPRPSIAPEPAPVAAREPEPPVIEFEDLVVPADSVLGLQIERSITSDTARVEDRVEARVTRDVRVGDKVAIPAGSVVQGSVIEVERGGKVRERARLGIRFHTVVMADGTRLSIRTDTVMREGASPAKESAAKIGGAAVGGAILGAILGGGKGAVIGGATGAAGGTAATMAGDRNPATLPAGTTVSVRVQQPVTVTVEK